MAAAAAGVDVAVGGAAPEASAPCGGEERRGPIYIGDGGEVRENERKEGEQWEAKGGGEIRASREYSM